MGVRVMDSGPMRRKNMFDGSPRYITFGSVGNIPHWIPSSSSHNFTQPSVSLSQCLFLSAIGLLESSSFVVSLSVARRVFPTVTGDKNPCTELVHAEYMVVPCLEY